MAAKTARLKASDFTLMAISSADLSTRVRAARNTKSPAVVDSTAIKDEYRFNQTGIKDHDFIVTQLIETSGVLHALLDAAADVTWSTDIAGVSLNGRGYLFDYETGVEVDGVQTEAVRLSVNQDSA